METRYTYKVRLHKAKEGGYVVTVPSLPGCHTYGATQELALSHAREAIQGFVETLLKLARSVPTEHHANKLTVQVRLPAMA